MREIGQDWVFPPALPDIAAFNAWLDALPVEQRDELPEDAARFEDRYIRLGLGAVVTRETIEKARATPDHDAVDKLLADRQLRVLTDSAYLVMGFALGCPEGLMWRTRPQLAWKDDRITDNWMCIFVCEVARDD